MRRRFEATITGRVRGVMYRDFTQRFAQSIGLVGTVENMPDGSVRVVAEGEEEKLRELLIRLKKGSALAQVERVVVEWSVVTGNYADFRIVYHGVLDRL